MSHGLPEPDLVADLGSARTLLFVPADRPERFSKADAAGADLIILDLEDSVRAEHKDQARANAYDWMARGHRAAVRINAVGTSWHGSDVTMLATLASRAFVILPMVENPTDASNVYQEAGGAVLAIIETARGVLHSPEIAEADGVVRLGLGALDLANDLGTDDPGTMAVVRTQLVIASRAAGLRGPVDSVTTDLTDPELAGKDARAGKAVGMDGKFCVHPNQVVPVAGAFLPSSDLTDWARRVLGAGTSGGVKVVDGSMVDEPVLARARRIIADATQSSAP